MPMRQNGAPAAIAVTKGAPSLAATILHAYAKSNAHMQRAKPFGTTVAKILSPWNNSKNKLQNRLCGFPILPGGPGKP